MHLRIHRTSRNGRTYEYAQLVEAYRDEKGTPTKKVIANLGALDPLTYRNLTAAFSASRVGQAVVLANTEAPELEIATNLLYLPVAVLLSLWRTIGLERVINRLLPGGEKDVRLVDVLAALVIQRCIEPASKWKATGWFPTTALPELLDLAPAQFNNTRLHRVLDALDNSADRQLQDALVELRQARGQPSSAFFIDLTDTWFVGEGPEMAESGKTKEGLYRRKIGIVLVCDPDGLPVRWSVVRGREDERVAMLNLIESSFDHDWMNGSPLVCDRAMGATDTLKRLAQMEVRFLTALRRNEFDAYTDKVPWTLLDGIDPHTAKAAEQAGEAMKQAMVRFRDDLFISDLGILERGVLPPRSETGADDKTVEVMRLASEMEQALKKGEAKDIRAAARRFGLKKEWAAKLLRLRRLPPDLIAEVEAGHAAGMSIMALRRVAAENTPEKQREAYQRESTRARCELDGRMAKRLQEEKSSPTKEEMPFQVKAILTFNPQVFVEQRRGAAKKLAQVESYVRSLNRENHEQAIAERRIHAFLEKKSLQEVYSVLWEETSAGRGNLRLSLDEAVWRNRRRFDGFSILVAHPDVSLKPVELSDLYRSKDRVEKDFHIIKSIVKLRPIRHYRDEKVRAHVTICVLALLLERTLERTLRLHDDSRSAAEILNILKTNHLNVMELPESKSIYKLTRPGTDQMSIITTLGLTSLVDKTRLVEAIHPR